MNLVIYSVFLIYLVILVFKKAEFVFFIPLFHVFVDVSFFYLGAGSIATYYRGIVLAIFLIYIYRGFRHKFPLKFILLSFLLYTGILSFTSTEMLYSIKGFSQVFFSMMMLPVGYLLINNQVKYARLNRQFLLIIFVSVAITAIGYLFNIGKLFNYSEEELRIGLLGSAGLYTGAVCIALMPMLITSLKNNSLKIITYIMAIVLFIFIMLNMRRTAIMIPFVGVLAFILTTRKKIRYFVYVAGAALIVGTASIIYGDTLRSRFEYRQEAGRFEKDFYKTESRYLEVVKLSGTIFTFSDPLASLFGIGNNIFAEHIQNNKIVRRMYHTDFGKLLYGSGIFGLLLYLLFCAGLIYFSRIYIREQGELLNQSKSMIFALAVINIALMFNGSLNLITLKSAIFLYTGALLRIYHGELLSQRNRLRHNGRLLSSS
jgi:hypothetical protein